ncbi:MAG: hypothetical protein IPJ86_14890 [Bacteroidetes bacterium]|nr:hypothetical protein [Bacteroidota bacterium]
MGPKGSLINVRQYRNAVTRHSAALGAREGGAELQVIIARYPEQGKAQAMLGSIYLHHLADFTAAEEAFRIAMRQAAILEIKQKTENGGKCQMLELPENNKLTAMYLLSWHNDR